MVKICPSCGKENINDAEFCKNCGNKLDNVNITKSSSSKSIPGGMSNWWNKRTRNEKVISSAAACCIGLFIIILVIAALAPELTTLSINNANAQIDNKTTEYIINGTTDPNAQVYITSSSLNITKAKATVDNKTGKFQYKLKIPINTADLNVEVSAVAPDKLEASQTVSIQRPLTPLTINPVPTLTEKNKTVTIEGNTDPNAEITISSKELGVNGIKINADSNGKFKYTVNVPNNISSASVSITAKSNGKRVNTQSTTIIRESTPPPAPANTNTNTDTGSASDSTSSSDSSSNSATGTFVGSINSDVYHYPSCASAKRIHSENLITFNSVTEAKNAGYRPCEKCHPPG